MKTAEQAFEEARREGKDDVLMLRAALLADRERCAVIVNNTLSRLADSHSIEAFEKGTVFVEDIRRIIPDITGEIRMIKKPRRPQIRRPR